MSRILGWVPFMVLTRVPREQDGTVRLVETAHGGHCGYLEGLKSISMGSLDAIVSKVNPKALRFD